MNNFCIVYGAILVILAGCMCMPVKRMFLDVNCDEKIDCDAQNNATDPDSITPVCATDGHTYDSKCHMSMENQRRYCIIGDFNPIVMVHTGNCTEQEAFDMLW